MAERIAPGVWRWAHPTQGVVIVGVHGEGAAYSLDDVVAQVLARALVWRRVRGPKDLPVLKGAPRELVDTYFSLLGQGFTVMGMSPDSSPLIMVTMSMPREARPEEVLTTLLHLYPDFPPALAAMLYTAVHIPPGMRSAAPAAVASINHAWPLSRSTVLMDKRQIQRLADDPIREARRSNRLPVDIPMPGGPIDRVRWLLHFSQRLWRPDVIRLFAHLPLSPEDEERVVGLGLIALITPLLRQGLRVRVGEKVTLFVRGDRGQAIVWTQVLEFERGGITGDTLNFLTQNRMPWGKLTVSTRREDFTPPIVPPRPASPHPSGPAAEAAKGPFRPAGKFTVSLPRDFPLRAWGVSALRVHAFPEPEGLWVGILDDEGDPSICFWWRPDGHISRWGVVREAVPLLDLTLAALWHDLRVARERAFPERGKGRRGGEEKGGSFPAPSPGAGAGGAVPAPHRVPPAGQAQLGRGGGGPGRAAGPRGAGPPAAAPRGLAGERGGEGSGHVLRLRAAGGVHLRPPPRARGTGGGEGADRGRRTGDGGGGPRPGDRHGCGHTH